MRQEAALGDAVGLVVELLRPVLVEIVQFAGLQDLGVDLSDAVHGEGADDGQEGHADLSVLDDAHAV